eukprot:evm.model.NODE_15513_length_34403_cov_16.618464.10
MASTAFSLEDGISSSPGTGNLRESSLESKLETLSLLPHKTEEDGEERIHGASGSGSNTPPLTSTVSTASSTSTSCSSGSSGIILGNSGQSKKSVLDMLHNNNGVIKIKQTDVNPHLVFIAPPSVEQLEARLRGRATESAEAIETRLSAARAEIEYGTTKGHFEHVVVNDELEKAYAELKATLIGYYPHLATTTV